MKLKVHTDLKLLSIGFPVELLIPFIGVFNDEDKPGRIVSSRFNDFVAHGKDYIELTEVEEADVCVLPVYYQLTGDVSSFEAAIQPFVAKATEHKKKMIVFTGYDRTDPVVNIDNCIIFNSAVNKSNQPYNVFAWPHFFEDFIQQYQNNVVVPRNKPAVPTIGFCGFAPPLGQKFSKAKMIGSAKLIANYLGVMRRFPGKASHSYRARAIIGLLKSNRIIRNFKIKSTFAFGPAGHLNTGPTKESDAAFRLNYVNNIIESDYTLCVRGIGNNSIRFFESLCSGRIPIFVNTDSVLPFDFMINWKELCVWVEEKDIDHIDRIVLDFHNRMSEKEFIALQLKLRTIWQDYFSPLGFFKNIKLFLDK